MQISLQAEQFTESQLSQLTQANGEEIIEVQNDDYSNEDLSQIAEVLSTPTMTRTTNIPKNSKKTPNPSKVVPPKSKKAKIESCLDSAVHALTQVCQNSLDNSEFKIFGQHVAAQLEKLPVVQALQLQEQILSLLTRARLEQLRDNSSMPTASRSVLSASGTSPAGSSAYTYSNTEPPSPFQAECHGESHSSNFPQHTNVQVAASQTPSNFSINNQGHNTNGNSQGGVGLMTYFNSWQDN